MVSIGSSGSRNALFEPAANDASLTPKAVSSLVYHSRVVEPLAESDLAGLISSAQSRNLQEDITGVMVYDQGRLMQWLEGPARSLRRVWQSIRQDRRHTGISMIGQSMAAVRMFGSSAMALALRKERSASDRDRDPGHAVQLPTGLIDALFERPDAAPALLAGTAADVEQVTSRRVAPEVADLGDVRASLQRLVNDRIVPELLARHAGARQLTPVLAPYADELAHLLLAAEPGPAFALIDRLRGDGRSITQLCASLLEPAARALGDLWQSDSCNDFQVELGLMHLQIALRRAGGEASAQALPRLWHPHSVLVAPSPHESHLLASVIASEIFARAGWDVHAEFPDSDVALCRLVHDHWFDVLDLSLSAAFQREDRLPAMAASISAAHASSRNPGLIVMVNGRVFHEHPLAYADVGADLGSLGAADLEIGARSQLQGKRRVGLEDRA